MYPSSRSRLSAQLPLGRYFVGGAGLDGGVGAGACYPASGHPEQELPARHEDHVAQVRLARRAGAREHLELDRRIIQLEAEHLPAFGQDARDYLVDKAVRVLADVGEGAGLLSPDALVPLTLELITGIWVILLGIDCGRLRSAWLGCARCGVGGHFRSLLRVRDSYDCHIWRPTKIGLQPWMLSPGISCRKPKRHMTES